MRIGIIGAGNVGRTLTELFVRAGHDVMLSHKGPPEDLAAKLGGLARAATNEQTAQFGDVVVLALPFGRYLELSPEPFEGRIAIDATNYFSERDGRFLEIEEGSYTSSELIKRHLYTARLVKAFNNLPMHVLKDRARPRGAPDRIALPISSDYPEAKRVVAELIDDVGFDPVDVGGLVEGGQLHEPGGPLILRPLTIEGMRAVLGLGEGPSPHAP